MNEATLAKSETFVAMRQVVERSLQIGLRRR